MAELRRQHSKLGHSTDPARIIIVLDVVAAVTVATAEVEVEVITTGKTIIVETKDIHSNSSTSERACSRTICNTTEAKDCLPKATTSTFREHLAPQCFAKTGESQVLRHSSAAAPLL